MIEFMSPAGSGRGQFRGSLAARVDRGNLCTWMPPWLLPAGLLGTVALISLSGVWAYLLVGIWGRLCVSVCRRVHPRSFAGRRGGNNRNGLRDGEADYWRTKLM